MSYVWPCPREGLSFRKKKVLLETHIDDLNPELYDYIIDRLLQAGAHDAYVLPVWGKKRRPGALLDVVCALADQPRLCGLIFEETSTAGVRIFPCERSVLPRKSIIVDFRGHPCRVKVAYYQGRAATVSPEYDDCRCLAESAGVPLKRVYQEVRAAALTQEGVSRFGRKPSPGGFPGY